MEAIQEVFSEEVLLLDLPPPIPEDILRGAGPHTRELSKACKELYGPLMSLTPRDVNSSQALVSALTLNGRHLQLTALNLERASNAVTGGSLQALCSALPNLKQLRLHQELAATPATPDGLVAALSHACHLTALHFAPARTLHYGYNIWAQWRMHQCIGRLPQLQHLTLPAGYTFAPSAFSSLRACTQLSKLCFSRHIGQHIAAHNCNVRAWAEHLPALAAVEIETPIGLVGATALQLRLNTNSCTSEAFLARRALLEVASTTRLQSLQLYMHIRGGQTPVEQGWLTHLLQLTSLDVSYSIETHAQDNGAFNEVASAVPHLRHLRKLRLARAPCGPSHVDMLSARAVNCIASASSTLELLHLRRLVLPPLADALSGMTHLTSLGFDCCASQRGTQQTHDMPWLTALTRLEELTLYNRCALWPTSGDVATVLAVQHMVPLSSLRILRLRSCAFVDALYLQRLCGSLPQLQCLDLQGCRPEGFQEGLAGLGQLTELQELSLEVRGDLQPLKYVREAAPPSLQRCYVAPGCRLRRAAAVLGPRIAVTHAASLPY